MSKKMGVILTLLVVIRKREEEKEGGKERWRDIEGLVTSEPPGGTTYWL